MISELVSFKTKDKLELPGLLYVPKRKTKKVLIDLHGNGSSSTFYKVEQNNLLAERLTRKNVAYFPFNNRGGHLIKSFTVGRGKKKHRVLYGCAHERIRECVLDIDAAVSYLKKRGFTTFYLSGHSTGANKICVYNHYKKHGNPFSRYIIVAGGDDTGLYYSALGKKRFSEALRVSRRYARSKRQRELAPKTMSPFYEMSYKSLYDTINPDGDYNVFPFGEYFSGMRLSKKKLFRMFAALDKPTLVIYGSLDEYCIGSSREALNVLEKHTNHPDMLSFTLIPGADHSFAGKRRELANSITTWLSA